MATAVRQEQEEAGTDVIEVTAGVLRLQLPITMPGLGHVNCYAIPDRHGVAIVDPGLPGPDAWRDLLDRLGRAGIKLAPVVVNGLYPPVAELDADPRAAAESAGAFLRPGEADALGAAARFRRGRQGLQAEQLARLAEALPLPQVGLPYLFTPEVGPPEIDVLAEELARGVRSLPEPAGAKGSRL